MLRRGDDGIAVADLRRALAELGLLPAADGDLFDEDVDAAVRGFQQQRGLIVDGIVGPITDRELVAATWTLGDRPLAYTLSAPVSGDDVAVLQSRLAELGFDTGQVNGIFTAHLDAAVREYQQQRGLIVDGIVGPDTVRDLERIAPMATGGRPHYLRGVALLREAGPYLRGKKIVIDPAHGADERGWSVGELCAADIVFDLAERLAARVVDTGMQAVLTRGRDENPSVVERARLANEVEADLLISLHVDGSASPQAAGIATFHFGTDTGNDSSVGEALASLIHRELIARTGMIDCRVHHRPWDILRRTVMPAVQVELGYLTNATDRARLVDEEFRDRVAEGMLVAVKRLYLDDRDDRPTGTFSFHDLLEYERAMQR